MSDTIDTPETGETPDAMDSTPRGTPKHLWVVGVIAVLWNSMGAWDYFATQTQNESYMSAFTPEQLEFFYGFPSWLVAFWAIAVWGGVLGSVLLLMRKRLAVPVFLASLVSMLVTTIHNFGFSNALDIMDSAFPLIFSAVIFLTAVGLYMYARSMTTRGVLS
jgi:hypothetical protein